MVHTLQTLWQKANEFLLYSDKVRKKEMLASFVPFLKENSYAVCRRRRQRSLRRTVTPLLPDQLVIFAGVPFDDVGGGQRSSQLARTAIQAGIKATYVYLYEKYDLKKRAYVKSSVNYPLLQHLHIAETNPTELFHTVSRNSTVLIELPHPAVLPFFDQANRCGLKTVYELIDDWDSSLGGDWYSKEVHRQFISGAAVVTVTARVLGRAIETYGRTDCLYLPNAANERIFDQYGAFPVPMDFIRSRYKHKLLYFGSLYGEWFGWDYIDRAARDNPDYGFYLIGDHGRIERTLPANVHFLGGKDIGELPAYLRAADAALLPFIPGAISDAVSPIKVFEYLFMKKPVVSTTMPEVAAYPGVLPSIDEAAFSDNCKKAVALANNGSDTFIAANTWGARLDAILDLDVEACITAVILMHNNAGIISRAIDTLYLHCSKLLQQVIVVDNASSDNGCTIVAENFPRVKLVRNDKNGCSSGRNLAARQVTSKYILFLDSDQWFTSCFGLHEALRILEGHAGVGAVGWAGGWFDLDNPRLAADVVDELPERGMASPEAVIHGFRTDIGYLGTGGMVIGKRTFDLSGGFDEFYDPTCFEDTDFSLKLKSIGFSVAYRNLSGIQHQPHQTTKASADNLHYEQLFRRNAEYFRKKWAAATDLLTKCPGY